VPSAARELQVDAFDVRSGMNPCSGIQPGKIFVGGEQDRLGVKFSKTLRAVCAQLSSEHGFFNRPLGLICGALFRVKFSDECKLLPEIHVMF